MENLFQFCWGEIWKSLITPASLFNLILLLALIVTGLTLCLTLSADAQVQYPSVSMGFYR